MTTVSRIDKSIGLFAKEPYKRDDILQKRTIILSILLTVATPYEKKDYVDEPHASRWLIMPARDSSPTYTKLNRSKSGVLHYVRKTLH